MLFRTVLEKMDNIAAKQSACGRCTETARSATFGMVFHNPGVVHTEYVMPDYETLSELPKKM